MRLRNSSTVLVLYQLRGPSPVKTVSCLRGQRMICYQSSCLQTVPRKHSVHLTRGSYCGTSYRCMDMQHFGTSSPKLYAYILPSHTINTIRSSGTSLAPPTGLAAFRSCPFHRRTFTYTHRRQYRLEVSGAIGSSNLV
jgi:hypothetical protein